MLLSKCFLRLCLVITKWFPLFGNPEYQESMVSLPKLTLVALSIAGPRVIMHDVHVHSRRPAKLSRARSKDLANQRLSLPLGCSLGTLLMQVAYADPKSHAPTSSQNGDHRRYDETFLRTEYYLVLRDTQPTAFQLSYFEPSPRHTVVAKLEPEAFPKGDRGTAACVVAGRLAEADPELSILVIEGGQDNFNVPSVVNPLLYYQHLLPTSKTALFYKAKASEHLAGRESIVPSGDGGRGTLGGGSSINFMMYTRAQREDFDSWNTPGWTTDEIIPFMQKLETYHGPGDASIHGYSGPVHISNGGYSAKNPEDDYIKVLETYGGLPESQDMQSLDANNCCERSLRYVSPEGKRQDAAHTFLHPKLQDGKHPNLHVLVETNVVRVLFDDAKKACGVEVAPNPDFQLQIGVTKTPKQVFKARKLVVVSCGANGTPSVLERSGIGGKEVLEKAGVPVVVDLPGVGNNWQDHHLILLPFKTSLQPRETSDFIISGRVKEEDLIQNNDKILGWNYIEVGVKMQPSEADRATFDKDLLAAWEKDFKDKPNKPLMLMGIINGFVGDQSILEPGQYVLMANYTAYPYSRGSMHITGPDFDDALDFDVGFFSDPGEVDLKKQVWAYKKQREFMRRTKMFRGEVALGHPKFSATSKAALVGDVSATGLNGPDVQDLEYTAEDDKAIEQFLRENIQTTWHSLGSCKMAPREEMGAVDDKLNVYGVQNLKVADLSIPPENVGANTNNTALIIGEKAADIIVHELGLLKN